MGRLWQLNKGSFTQAHSVGMKLTCVIFAFLMVVAIFLYLLLSEKNIAIDFAEKEITGNRMQRPIQKLALVTHQYRLATSQPEQKRYKQAVLTHLGEVEASLIQHQATIDMHTSVQQVMQLQEQLEGKKRSFVPLASTIQKITRDLGDRSNLILDPDLDSYYIMDLTLLGLPEEQARLSDILAMLQSRKKDFNQTEIGRERLNVQIGLLRQGVLEQEHSLLTAANNNPSHTVEPTLKGAFERKVALLEHFCQVYRDAKSGANTPLTEEDINALISEGNIALQSSYSFWDSASSELDSLLTARVQDFERRKWMALSLAGLILVPALLFGIFLIVRITRTIKRVSERLEQLRTREITQLEQGIVALASGAREPLTLQTTQYTPLPIIGKDELAMLSTSLNHLSSQTAVTTEALGTTQELLLHAEVALRDSEEQMRHQAFHDKLTQLPNRAFLLDQMEHTILRAQHQQKTVAALFLDLDNFKVVNDSLGHQAGDMLLQEIARRLLSIVPQNAVVARLGGDEFFILLEEIDSQESIMQFTEDLRRCLSNPTNIGDREIVPSSSIGVAFSERGVVNTDELVKHADIAMYRAKQEGKHRFALFDPQMNEVAQARLRREAELRHAINNEELVLYYQPIYALDTGAFCEAEALVRWQHPREGLLPPSEFIDLSEETGLIIPLGTWVIRAACRQAYKWNVPISVNLSLQQLLQPDIAQIVADALRDSNVSPHLICLEITETLMGKDPQHIAKQLYALKALGVRLALDDFGTGYSSMAYLRDMPIDTLKIDRSFIRDAEVLPKDEAIISAMLRLAHALNLTVVCEGIETQLQQDCLQRLQCAYGQGFLYSPPMPPAQIEHYLPLSMPPQEIQLLKAA
jgi:diguanylate cyclase (GGDEF)-like protein